MRKPVKTAVLFIGFGAGVLLGSSFEPAAVWYGLGFVALGLVLSLVGTTQSELIGDGVAIYRGDDAGAGDRDGPTLKGLGTRVEQILRLAEEQAGDHRAEAKRESEAILAAARLEAEEILRRAREQAGVPLPGARTEPPGGALQETPPATA